MYAIEGTIGAGKSLFIHLLADKLDHLSVALESMHAWQRAPLGQQLLEKFYKVPKRWSYTLETYMMTCRVKEYTIEQKRNLPFRLIERSIFSGHYVFAKNDYLRGNISQLEWAMYNQWFTFLVQAECTPPLGFIYLRVDPQQAHQRIIHRNRSSEKSITQEYLTDVCTAYDNFLLKREGGFEKLINTPVLTLDFNVDLQKKPAIIEKYVKQVQDFITQTQPYKPACRLTHFPVSDQQNHNLAQYLL